MGIRNMGLCFHEDSVPNILQPNDAWSFFSIVLAL